MIVNKNLNKNEKNKVRKEMKSDIQERARTEVEKQAASASIFAHKIYLLARLACD